MYHGVPNDCDDAAGYADADPQRGQVCTAIPAETNSPGLHFAQHRIITGFDRERRQLSTEDIEDVPPSLFDVRIRPQRVVRRWLDDADAARAGLALGAARDRAQLREQCPERVGRVGAKSGANRLPPCLAIAPAAFHGC